MPNRSAAVLSFILAYTSQHEYPPTLREIAEGVGLASTGVALYYLRQLEARGRIERTAKHARATRVVADSESELETEAPQRISPHPSRGGA